MHHQAAQSVRGARAGLGVGPRLRLGEALVAKEAITREQLQDALDQQVALLPEAWRSRYLFSHRP